MSRIIVWSMLLCLPFLLQAQSAPPPIGDDGGNFRTQTIGGWGSKPSGNNPGAYLHANFNEAFSNGVTIGCDANVVIFTSAQAITDFLPSGGTAAVLEGTALDPTTAELRNVLAAQVLALSLSIQLDRVISDFGESSGLLANQKIAIGPLEGKTVRFVLEEANKILGGKDSPYSLSQINEAVSMINESYVDGEQTNAFLTSF